MQKDWWTEKVYESITDQNSNKKNTVSESACMHGLQGGVNNPEEKRMGILGISKSPQLTYSGIWGFFA